MEKEKDMTYEESEQKTLENLNDIPILITNKYHTQK